MSHNLLRAHATALAAYRAEGRHAIGIVLNLAPQHRHRAQDDRAAARRADAWMNRQYLDPLYLGRYPEELPEIFGEAWPEFPSSDFDAIGEPIDFLGVNYYTRNVVRHEPKAWPVHAAHVPQPGLHTEMKWESTRRASPRSSSGSRTATEPRRCT